MDIFIRIKLGIKGDAQRVNFIITEPSVPRNRRPRPDGMGHCSMESLHLIGESREPVFSVKSVRVSGGKATEMCVTCTLPCALYTEYCIYIRSLLQFFQVDRLVGNNWFTRLITGLLVSTVIQQSVDNPDRVLHLHPIFTSVFLG